MAHDVLYETDGHVAIITLNRPGKHNAMSPEVIRGFRSDTATFCYAEVLRGFSGAGLAIALLPRQVPYAPAVIHITADTGSARLVENQ